MEYGKREIIMDTLRMKRNMRKVDHQYHKFEDGKMTDKEVKRFNERMTIVFAYIDKYTPERFNEVRELFGDSII